MFVNKRSKIPESVGKRPNLFKLDIYCALSARLLRQRFLKFKKLRQESCTEPKQKDTPQNTQNSKHSKAQKKQRPQSET